MEKTMKDNLIIAQKLDYFLNIYFICTGLIRVVAVFLALHLNSTANVPIKRGQDKDEKRKRKIIT